MALIKCYECSKEISDKAISCPNCGAPTNLDSDKKNQQLKKGGFSQEEKDTDNLQREITTEMRDDGYTGQGTYTSADGSIEHSGLWKDNESVE